MWPKAEDFITDMHLEEVNNEIKKWLEPSGQRKSSIEIDLVSGESTPAVKCCCCNKMVKTPPFSGTDSINTCLNKVLEVMKSYANHSAKGLRHHAFSISRECLFFTKKGISPSIKINPSQTLVAGLPQSTHTPSYLTSMNIDNTSGYNRSVTTCSCHGAISPLILNNQRHVDTLDKKPAWIWPLLPFYKIIFEHFPGQKLLVWKIPCYVDLIWNLKNTNMHIAFDDKNEIIIIDEKSNTSFEALVRTIFSNIHETKRKSLPKIVSRVAANAALDVFSLAPEESIKAFYRDVCNRLHPDKGGDTAKFQQLQQAWNILKKERTV